MHPVEHEIKLRMADVATARAALQRLGARLEQARHFEDNVLLDDKARSLLAAGKVLRVRRAGDRGVFTYKGPRSLNAGVRSREEIEIEIADPEALSAILAGAGLVKIFRYQKFREVYLWGEVEIVIDETPIGTFLEIEGPAPAIHETARALGRAPDDYILESYASLFVAEGGQGDMVFP